MKQIKHLFLITFLFPLIMSAQNTVDGIVLDENNFPIPGAFIIIKGTDKGKITDFDGNFSIVLDKFPSILIVSFLGYATQEIVIENQQKLTITLKEDSQKLDEVVIIGYGEVKRKDVTGSITSIKPLRNSVAQAQGVENLLQGRAAGVLVSANSNEPGATVSVKIRGTNSLTGNTEPLYVIDGIIMDSATEDVVDPLQGSNSSLSSQNGITGVNPRDIENIEILKDASATAIYGSRGANGVVLITTKKGEKGEAKFNYATTTRIGKVSKEIDILEAGEYVNYFNDIQAVNGNLPRFFVYSDGSIAEFDTSEEFMIENSGDIARLDPINWNDDTYKTSVTQNHRVTTSGGGDNGDYYFGLGYAKNEGVIPNAFAKSVDFTMKLNNDLSEKLKLSTKVSAYYGDYSASKGTEDLGGTNSNLVRQIVTGAPVLNLSDNFFGLEGDFSEGLDGPRVWIKDYDDLSREVRILGSVSLDYKLSKVFTYNIRIGTDYRNKQRKVWYGTSIFRGSNVNGEAGIATLSRFRYNIDNTLRFRKSFNKNHRINGTIGAVIDQRFLQQIANTGSGFAVKDLRADGISNAEVTQPSVLLRENESLLSFLGRFNYTFKNRYLFTATYRADGSSRFAPGNRWGHFPAVALAWKMDKEPFLKDVESIDELKLRVGWGLTGNQAIPNYRFYTLMTGSNLPPYGDVSNGSINGLVQPFLSNPDLLWETSDQYNAGIDLSLWDRVNFTGDVFYKEVTDLLQNREIPPSNGFTQVFVNEGTLINKGIELSLNADVIDNEKFKWNVFGNISFIKNRIENLGIPPAPYGSETYSAYFGRIVSGGNHFKVPANIFIEGEAPGLFFGFETDGIINDQTELDNSPSFQGVAPQLGDVKLVDLTGDGNITDADRTIIGDPNPDFNYGFGSSFEYKGLSLSFFFNGVQGNDIVNGNLLREGYASGRNSDNIRAVAYNNAWSPENPNGTYPRLGYDLETTTGLTDRIVEDGSLLRLNYVTLGYDIPMGEKSFFDNAYVSVSGQNLWLITNYSGYDPEVNSFAYDPSRVGVDWNSFPNQKSYSMSLNLSF
ncbi:MAG: TonB-linked SusC/RagA family outer membrane protein [Urechidicola sp.]|jgi:TonB-linked SusC/RagA family outer membrane protein|tara:strand:+ start:3820 stop:7002 length:3183 start_codon:yes stop_codon:yes gene_type:complete